MRNRFGALASLVGRLVLAVALALPVAVRAGSLPVNTRMGGDFSMMSTSGSPIALSSLRGKVVLMTFGYTQCPDVCPMVVARMVHVLKRLGDKAVHVQPVFVTFDPERDTPARLKGYLEAFDKRFIGFSGSAAETAALAERYGVTFLPEKTDSAAGLLYTHSDYIYLLDQKGKVRAVMGSDESVSAMVTKVESLIGEE